MPEGGKRGAGRDPDMLISLILKHHGHRAIRVAAARASRLVEMGDRTGATKWLRISEALVKKARETDDREYGSK